MNGSNVTLSMSSTGGLDPIHLAGTRSGTQCSFLDTNGPITAYCGRDAFNAEFKSTTKEPKLQFSSRAVATNVVDRVAQAKARAEAKQKYEQYIASLPRASEAEARLARSAVTEDSRGWTMNHLDAGSMQNVVRMPDTTDSVRVYYTYNGGAQGFVDVKMANARVDCLSYFDWPTCRRPRSAAPGGLLISSVLQEDASPPADALLGRDTGESSRTSIDVVRRRAEAGDARAQEALGSRYRDGEDGLPIDYAQMLLWFRRSAGQHECNAEFFLGDAYQEGKGVPIDYAEALRWYKLSAADGEEGYALLWSGELYLRGGPGLPSNRALATSYFQKALASNVAFVREHAQERLNTMRQP